MPSRSHPSRGFTLIELMIVVTVIGLLSSVAIPSFRSMQLRSKQAERSVIMSSIHRGIEDYWVREGKFPADWGGGFSFLNLTSWNPNATPSTQKRPWRQSAGGGDWAKLSLVVDGAVYYSYYGYGYSMPDANRYDLLYAMGDLDGDRVNDEWQKEWYYQGTRLLQYPGSSPTDCTWEWRWPSNGTAF